MILIHNESTMKDEINENVIFFVMFCIIQYWFSNKGKAYKIKYVLVCIRFRIHR